MTKFLSLLALVLIVGIGNAWGTSATWALVTSEPSDWSGEYLIVYNSNCFDGSLTSSSLNGNAGQSVSISSNKITKDDSYSLTVSKVSGKYYLQTASGYYIGRKANSNGVDASTSSSTDYVVTFSNWNSTNKTVKIAGTGGRCLGNNSGSWKFFSSSNAYVNVSLYKKEVASGPTITASSSMTTFGCNMTTGASVVQSFTVGETNLTENLSVTPPSGYEICLTSGGTYQTSAISLTPSTGTVSTTTIYVRLRSANAAGSYSGNIACASSGATTQNVAVSGSTPFKVTWKANGSTHATTYVAYATNPGTAIGSFPDDPDPDDYTCSGTNRAFYGWYDGSYSHASTAPTIITTSTKITSDKTFNAVFADAVSGDPVNEWQQCTTLDDFVDGDFYLFVSPQYNSTYYYVPAVSAAATQGTFSSSADGNNVASNSTPTSITKAQGAWKLIKSSTSWKIQSSNASTIYLYSGTDNNKLGAATSGTASSTWSITKHASTSTFAFQYNSSRYLCAYNQSPYGFRTYTSTGTNGTAYLTVYHWVSSTPTVYSNYATTCCTNLDPINGSFIWT